MKKIWKYIKDNKLQAKTSDGKPETSGKFIIADLELLKVFQKTNLFISCLNKQKILKKYVKKLIKIFL